MADEKFRQEIDAYVDGVWEDYIADLGNLVAIESAENLAEAGEGHPWGIGPAKALDCILGIAGRMGFGTHNADGYLGWAELPGENTEKYLATIGHVDCVPIGTGWSVEPLKMTRKDGYLLGRGTGDDKGPTLAALYALKFFLDKGEKLPYTFRAIFGADEEASMKDAAYYLANFPAPAFLFTPDSDFPVGIGEKGRYVGRFVSGDLGDGRIVEFDGGTVVNAVPSEAMVRVKADAAELPAAEDIDIEDLGDGTVKLVSHGISSHAMKPEGSKNAIKVLVDYLLEQGICSPEERAFLELQAKIMASTDGSSLGFASADDIFDDPTTHIAGTVRMEDGRIVQTIDSRYVSTTNGDAIRKCCEEAAAACGASFEPLEVLETYTIAEDSPEVQALISSYRDISGNYDAKPFRMGGGTYARHFPNAASYGSTEKAWKKPAWVGHAHSHDEGIGEATLRQAMKVYILAISRLMEIEY